MPSPPDRPLSPLEVLNPGEPVSPLSFNCASGFDRYTVDLWWSNPAELAVNSQYNMLGVNVYRSFDSEFGPYTRLNTVPVASLFFRDRTQSVVTLEENVSDSFVCRGDTDPSGRWIFRTLNRPIHIQPSVNIDTADLNVFVTIDGRQARVKLINSVTGEIEISKDPIFDVASQTLKAAVVPSRDSVVLASYRFFDDTSKTSLYQRIFYKATSVASDHGGNIVETQVGRAVTTNTNAVENIDWIWREAIRRNKFILYQGGERVKAFIRKYVGPHCGCSSQANKQPASDCLVCFGTGIIGGYDGPYDLLIAPDDSERKIEQSNRGRSNTHSYETWTGPNPLLSQRDFLVKLNGDRYGLGPVRMPTNRGMQLQQHFVISHLDESDIRYKVPVLDTSTLIVPQTRYIIPGDGNSTPLTTQRDSIPSERQIRGRTVTFENNNNR